MAAEPPEQTVVMIADDNPDQITVIEKLVSSEVPGCIFVRVGGIKRAIEILRQTPPKLLILESRFHDGTANEVLTQFPRSQRLFTCFVVTSDKSEETLKTMFELGTDDFLVKPLDELIFHSKLRSLLGRQYMSPLSFLGRKEGLADIKFTSPIQITHISEDKVTFLCAFPIAKLYLVEFQLRKLRLRATVQSAVRHPKLNSLYEIQGNLDTMSEANANEFRRILVELISAQQNN